MTPEEALAREEIRYTQSVYNSEGDRGRIDGLVTAFTDDGVLELDHGVFKGHDAIRAALRPLADDKRAGTGDADGPKVFVRHNLTTSRVEFVSGGEANAWTYFQVVTPVGLDHVGVYVDRFVKAGERWLLTHRRVKVDWISERSTIVK
jgi:hypothetical protein